jgi:hypothetical protein
MNATNQKTASLEETFFYVLDCENVEALQVCWKVREGLRKKICFQRIKTYADWYFSNFLHFQLERKMIVTTAILGKDHELTKKMLTKHRRIKRVFSSNEDVERSLHRIEEELENLIRFEDHFVFVELRLNYCFDDFIEREFLFPKFFHACEDWSDQFWELKR